MSIEDRLAKLTAEGLRWRIQHRSHGYLEASYPDWDEIAAIKVLVKTFEEAVAWLEANQYAVPHDYKSF